jgi:peptidoglycan/LPS O-acetylase OafA/YrhL
MNIINQLDPRLGNWLTKNLRKAEIIILIVIALGLILKMLELNFGGVLIIISISTLAVFYFWSAYEVFENAKPFERFLSKLLSFGWSISIIGIQFLVQGWPGFEPMLTIGPVPLLVALIVILILKEKNIIENSIFDKSKLIRTFVIASLAISLHFCPKGMLIKYHIISKQPIITENKNAS